jgi:hypothetical protein
MVTPGTLSYHRQVAPLTGLLVNRSTPPPFVIPPNLEWEDFTIEKDAIADCIFESSVGVTWTIHQAILRRETSQHRHQNHPRRLSRLKTGQVPMIQRTLRTGEKNKLNWSLSHAQPLTQDFTSSGVSPKRHTTQQQQHALASR